MKGLFLRKLVSIFNTRDDGESLGDDAGTEDSSTADVFRRVLFV